MAKIPEFRPVETSRGWMVSIPATMTGSGERKRKYFPTEAKAKKFSATVRASHASGVRGAMISATLAIHAAEAERILAGTGITVVEAARMAVAKIASSGSRETFGERYARAQLANESRWSDRYRSQMDALPRWLPPEFMTRPCGSIDRESIEAALLAVQNLARSTIDMKSSRVLAVLGYRERHRKRADVAILTPAQCGRVLRVCARREERWVVALLLWAGVRPDSEGGEISRLEWDAVGENEIYISRDVSKTPSDRHIPISRRLRRMLKGCPKSGPVTPSGWKRAWSRIRKAAGIASLYDVCRHTYASNHLAAFGMDATQSAMGHVAMSPTTRRHYVSAVLVADGARYFR